jgi:hypothetical protein
MKAVINLKRVVGKKLETITRTVELSYFDHRSFDDIVEDCLLKIESHNDIRGVEIVITKQKKDENQ